MRIQMGRWRAELCLEFDVWRVRSRPPQRIVLWGAREGQVQFGSLEDRVGRLADTIYSTVLADFARVLAHADHVHVAPYGGFSIVPFAGIPEDVVVVVEPGTAVPVGAIVELGPGEAMPSEIKLRAYSGARGWADGDRA